MSVTKHTLRRQMALALREFGPDDILNQSQCIANNVFNLRAFKEATAICVYLSMPRSEASTDAILEYAFEMKKTVYVPKITGQIAKDMKMVKVISFKDIATFPKDKWSIPDPHLSLHGKLRQDPLDMLDLDLIIMPGVAFDRTGARLGHGKGYYDCYLQRLKETYCSRGVPLPKTIGIGFNCQLIPSVPTTTHDQSLDFIVTPSETIVL